MSQNQFDDLVDLDTPASSFDISLRPPSFSEFIGQQRVCERLEIMAQAAKQRGDVLEHILLTGPQGLGKATIAHILANFLEVNIKATSGAAIETAGDLFGILTPLDPGDILFIDEIDRLKPEVEEYLHPAMKSFRMDIVIEEGPNERAVQIPLPKFIVVGSVAMAGSLSSALRSGFSMTCELDYYTTEELVRIVMRSAGLIGVPIDASAAAEIAARSRGVPRIANNLMRLADPRLRPANPVSRSEDEESPSYPAGTVRQRLDGMWALHVGVDENGLTRRIRIFDTEKNARSAAHILKAKYGPSLLDEATAAKLRKAKSIEQEFKGAPKAKPQSPALVAPHLRSCRLKSPSVLTTELWALAEARPDFEELPDWIADSEAATNSVDESTRASVAVEQSRAIIKSLTDRYGDQADRLALLESKPFQGRNVADLEEFAPFLFDAIQRATAFRKGVRRLPLAIHENAIRIGRHTQISFNRTLRIPENGREYPLPAGFGRLPILRVEDYPNRVPEKWLAEGGFIIPLYQREALFLEFSGVKWRPTIAKVAVGRVNAISGKDYDLVIRPHRQDYIAIPDQQWLDGINSGSGSVSQFVAMPLGKGYTIEAQITDEEKHGGFQLAIFDPRIGRFTEEDPSEKEAALRAREQRSLSARLAVRARKQRSMLEQLPESTGKIIRALQKFRCSAAAKVLGISEEEIRRTVAAERTRFERMLGPGGFDGLIPADHLAENVPTQEQLRSKAQYMPGRASFMPGDIGDRSRQPIEMGIGAGGRIKQQIIEDPYGPESWDESAFREVAIHIVNSAVYKQITGLEPPPSPISVAHYQSRGIPWYSDYKEQMPITSPAALFKTILTIGQIEKGRGVKEVAKSLHREIRPEEVLRIRTQTLQERVTALYQRARQSFNCGRYKIAAREASLALDIAKDFPPLHLIRAHANLILGFYSDAEADSSACLKLDPHNHGALKIRAHSALGLGEPLLAKNDAAKILESEPSDTAALCLRAQANLEMAEYAEALTDAEKILLQDHSDARALRIRSEALIALSKGSH
jgi:Holliday junction DNA helicase RuvB subunit